MLTQKQKVLVKKLREISKEYYRSPSNNSTTSATRTLGIHLAPTRSRISKLFNRTARNLPIQVAYEETMRHWKVPKKYWVKIFAVSKIFLRG
jgi:hypothetical protein